MELLSATLRSSSVIIDFFSKISRLDIVIAFVVSALLAIIPAVIASNKGHNGFGYFVFGLFMLPFAITTACLLPSYKMRKDTTDDAYSVYVAVGCVESEIRKIEKQLQETSDRQTKKTG